MALPRRLLFGLFALLLILPSLQAHAHAPIAPTETMHHMHMDGMAGHEMPQHHEQVPALHDCLGCIAPIDIAVYRPAELAGSAVGREIRPIDADLLLARASAPEPPPPRASV